MQPLIKWPGGKSSELEIINKFIPSYDRYIEPFFGGGALFFSLPPKPSIINDISNNLMVFYSFIKERNEKFKDCLYEINTEWGKLKEVALNSSIEIISVFKQFRNIPDLRQVLQSLIDVNCEKVSEAILKGTSLIIDKDCFKKEIRRMVTDKVFRTYKNEIKNGKLLSNEDLQANFITGFTSGYYMYLRDTLNRIEKSNEIFIATEYKIAVFYFVREFCYGAMFRYNKSGDFNIPYGGIAYNNKDFKRIIKPTGNIFIFTTYSSIGKWHAIFDHHFDTTQFMIWHKTNPAPKIFKNGFLNSCEMIICFWNKGHTWNFTNQRSMHNFIESPICMGSERLKNPKHPAQKPLKILKHVIEIASNPNDVIFDPFMGVGSTAIAALELNRKFCGCEIERVYYEATVERIKQFYISNS